MADRLMHVSWGESVAGREERGLEVFNEALGLYGRMQQEGRIEKFDVVILIPSGSGQAGYIDVHGTAEQLAALREDEEFRRNITDATMVVHDLAIADGYANQGVAQEIEIYRDSISRMPAAH